MDKLKKIFFFLFGAILCFSSILFFTLEIALVLEGNETEEQRIGGYVISFLLAPVFACGSHLIIKNRPKKRRKRIEITKILQSTQGNELNLTGRNLEFKLNLTRNEADSALIELKKIGIGTLSRNRFDQLELNIDKSTYFNKMKTKIDQENSIQQFKKSTDIFRLILRIFVSIFFISFSMFVIIFRISHCCGDGFYYLIFFSLIGGLSSAYLIWAYKKRKKLNIPQFIEIKS